MPLASPESETECDAAIPEVVADTVNAPGAVPKSTWELAASLVVQVTTADVNDGVAATPEMLGAVVSTP